MEEQLLHSDLLRNDIVGVAVPCHTLHLALEFHHFHVRFEDGLVAYHPYHFVYDAVLWHALLGLECVLLKLSVRTGIAACVRTDAHEQSRSGESRHYNVALFSHVYVIYYNMYSV